MTFHASALCGSTGMNELVGGQHSSGPVGEAGTDRCSKLSGGQLEVLRLVNNHLNSKEIAAALGISSHTVDQRVRGAIRTLGVTRRSEAARLVAAYDSALGLVTPADPPYQRLIHQA